MSSEYRPRLNAEITLEQADVLSKILPHGMKKPLFQALVEGVIAIYNTGGLPALGAITSNYISINQIVSIGLNRTRESQIKLLKNKLKELEDGNNI